MDDRPDLLELADRGIAAIRKEAPDLGAELYLYRGRDRGVELREGRLESIQESEETGMGLRLFNGRGMGFAFSGGLDGAMLSALCRRASEQLARLPADPHRVLPEPNKGPGSEAEARALERTVNDPTLMTVPPRELVPRLEEMHARATRADKRIAKVLQVGLGENASEVAIISTAGVRAVERGTSCSVGLYAMASAGQEVQVGSASRSARFMRDLDLDGVVDEAVFRTVSLLDARRLPSKRRAVLFDPWVAGEIVGLLAGPMSAETVQRGKSLLRGKIGKRIASAGVSFVDDPLRPGGIASAYSDDEGVPARRKTMVENGVLRDYFYDTYTAHKDGLVSNGCAGRAGFKGLPGATSSNFYMEPGTMSRDELVADTRDGILVFELMGMHTADPISGEISVGVSGVALRNGEISHGIRGAMLSGNLLDMLESVDAVADDLIFYGSLASPTFRVADLTIA
ncbi:MAG: TldD/PmbA family protein [Elusimicrobiota bacterium]